MTAINRFHNYLQARFDFIARAIEETQDQPEPVFFISELLDGFLEQEEFLDTLVADAGYDVPFQKRWRAPEDFFSQQGIEFISHEHQEMISRFREFVREYPDVWAGDVGQST